MKIKNFATFGLFVDGEMTDSGSIHAMENEATRRILSGQAEAAHISVFDFDGDKVVEKTPVLSLRRSNDNIISPICCCPTIPKIIPKVSGKTSR